MIYEKEILFYNAFGNYEIGILNESNNVYDMEFMNMDRNTFANKILCYDVSFMNKEILGVVGSMSYKSIEEKLVKCMNRYYEDIIKEKEHNGLFTMMKVINVNNNIMMIILGGLKGSVIYLTKNDMMFHIHKVKEYINEIIVNVNGDENGNVVTIFKKKVIGFTIYNEGNVFYEKEILSYENGNMKYTIMSDICFVNEKKLCYVILINSIRCINILECSICGNDITCNDGVEYAMEALYEVSCICCNIVNNDMNIFLAMYNESNPLICIHFSIESKIFNINNINTSSLISNTIHQIVICDNKYIIISYRNGIIQLLNTDFQQLHSEHLLPCYQHKSFPFNISNINSNNNTNTNNILTFLACSSFHCLKVSIIKYASTFSFTKHHFYINTHSHISNIHLLRNSSLCIYLTNSKLILSSLYNDSSYPSIITFPLYSFPRNEICTHITSISSSPPCILCLTKQSHYLKLYIFSSFVNSVTLQQTFNIKTSSIQPHVTSQY